MAERKLPHLFTTPIVEGEQHNYARAIAELRRAIDWFEKIGANPEPTRVGRYLRQLEEVDQATKANDLQSFYRSHDLGKHIIILSEVEEILGVWRFLSSESSAVFLAKLKQAIRGGIIPADETRRGGSMRARNVLFELFLGSVYTSAGFQVDFSKEADLLFSFEGRDIFVECKRPQRDHSVNGCIKGAAAQLLCRYPSSSDPSAARGVIALSIGKVITRGSRYRVSSEPPDFLREDYGVFLQFIARHKQRWNAKADSQTLGTLLYLNLPHFVRQDASIHLGQPFAWCRMERLSNEDIGLSDRLSNKFKKARITSTAGVD